MWKFLIQKLFSPSVYGTHEAKKDASCKMCFAMFVEPFGYLNIFHAMGNFVVSSFLSRFLSTKKLFSSLFSRFLAFFSTTTAEIFVASPSRRRKAATFFFDVKIFFLFSFLVVAIVCVFFFKPPEKFTVCKTASFGHFRIRFSTLFILHKKLVNSTVKITLWHFKYARFEEVFFILNS